MTLETLLSDFCTLAQEYPGQTIGLPLVFYGSIARSKKPLLGGMALTLSDPFIGAWFEGTAYTNAQFTHDFTWRFLVTGGVSMFSYLLGIPFHRKPSSSP